MEIYEIEIMVTNYNFVCGFTPIKYLRVLDYTLENMRLEPILNTIELELLYKTKKTPYNIRIRTLVVEIQDLFFVLAVML